MSDSDAVEFVHTKHQVAGTYGEAVRMVLEAGLNVRTNFTQPSKFIVPLRELIESGEISMSTVDRRVAEVLKVKFRLGLFDHPYVEEPAEADNIAGADKHLDFIDRMQLESLILLKNEDNILPLDKARTRNVLVTGPLADETNFMASRYGPNGLTSESILDGIRGYLEDEVVQLYVRDKYSSVVTYDSVLRGFERVSLEPGESKVVRFHLSPEDLQILDRNMEWTVEPGEFEIMAGSSSTDIRLSQTVELE